MLTYFLNCLKMTNIIKIKFYKYVLSFYDKIINKYETELSKPIFKDEDEPEEHLSITFISNNTKEIVQFKSILKSELHDLKAEEHYYISGIKNEKKYESLII